MPDFIAPIVDWLLAAIQDATPPLLTESNLPPFTGYRKSWTWAFPAWPPVAVMARTTDFDPEIQTARHQSHHLTVKFGLNGIDPDRLTADAMQYVSAIDAAINGAPWLPQISRVFIESHDYGPLYIKDSGIARFPELHVIIETFET